MIFSGGCILTDACALTSVIVNGVSPSPYELWNKITQETVRNSYLLFVTED